MEGGFFSQFNARILWITSRAKKYIYIYISFISMHTKQKNVSYIVG